jgi:hypothetical protein
LISDPKLYPQIPKRSLLSLYPSFALFIKSP